MSLYLTKEEKSEYEQRRRKQIIQDSRDQRLMFKWLTKMYPDILAQFYAFKTELQRGNPSRKDLTTAPAFHKFMQKEDGMVTVQKRMTVALTDVLRDSVRSQWDPLAQTAVGQSQQDPLTQTAADPPCTVSLNENPFGLTNEEIDELLKGLEGIDYEELKGLEGTDKGLPKYPEGSSVPSGHYIDTELDSILNMDVDDFIV